MREVFVSDTVRSKMTDLRTFLVSELKLSEEAIYKRIDRMRKFIASFGACLFLPGRIVLPVII